MVPHLNKALEEIAMKLQLCLLVVLFVVSAFAERKRPKPVDSDRAVEDEDGRLSSLEQNEHSATW